MSASTPPSTQTWQPGWYDDPDDPGRLRWFDGAAWSTSTLPRVDVVPDEVEPAEAEPVRVAPAQVAQVADKDRMVCKTEALAGSRVPKRVCATKGEWEARRAEDKEHLDAMQRASKPHISQ